MSTSVVLARAPGQRHVTIFAIALQDFDARTGDPIANLDAHALMDAFTEMFDKLAEAAGAPDGMMKRWKDQSGEGDPAR